MGLSDGNFHTCLLNNCVFLLHFISIYAPSVRHLFLYASHRRLKIKFLICFMLIFLYPRLLVIYTTTNTSSSPLLPQTQYNYCRGQYSDSGTLCYVFNRLPFRQHQVKTSSALQTLTVETNASGQVKKKNPSSHSDEEVKLKQVNYSLLSRRHSPT